METVRMALATLRSNRLRSLLTMVGIVIGNASVITLVGVGRGAQGLAEEQLSNLGANVLFVVPGNNDTRRRGVAFPRTLVLEDADAIAEQVPSVKRVAPQISSSQVVQLGARSSTSSISGITPEFLPVRSFEVSQGRFITDEDVKAARNVAVIGPDLEANSFRGDQRSDNSCASATSPFSGRSDGSKGAVFGSNQDGNTYIPLSTMVTRLTGRDPTYGVSLSFISVEARDESSTGAAKFQITNLLRQRHNILRDDDFAVRSQKDALSIVGTITGGLTLMLGAIGGISLLVGGIGIMNIMLVSVSERTQEIGLRKALGARSGDVLQQFLVESLVLASLGGAIGTAAGLGTIALVAAVTPLPASIGTSTVLMTVGLSGSIGLFFGVVPAGVPQNWTRSWLSEAFDKQHGVAATALQSLNIYQLHESALASSCSLAASIGVVLLIGWQVLNSGGLSGLEFQRTDSGTEECRCCPDELRPFPGLRRSWTVTAVDIYDGGRNAVVEAVDPDLDNRVQRLRVDLPGLAPRIDQHIEERGDQLTFIRPFRPTGPWSAGQSVIPAVVDWIPDFLARRNSGMPGGPGQAMQFGKSKARFMMEAETGVKFDDVAGVTEASRNLKKSSRS